MTDPSVTKHLQKKKAKIKGWNAYSDAIRDPDVKDKIVVSKESHIEEGSTLVTGGTCAALRTLSIAHIMGFRNFELFGFDCSIAGKVTEKMKKEKMDTGQKKYLHVELNGHRFWTTGELLAMAQDCEKLFDNMDIDMNITFHGEGTLVSEVWKNSNRYSQISYMEMMGVAA